MTASSYEESLRRLLVHEGGYSDHPSDPGGPTNFGITIHDYRKYVNASATAADVRSMLVETAKRIYREKYWNALSCDELPAGVDYAIFDYGVNSGISRSAKVLQRLVGVAVDGEIGPDTIAAAVARDPKVLAAAICDERLAFLRSLGTWSVFGRGWGRRVAEVRAAVLAMAGKAQAVTPSPVLKSSTEGPTLPPWLARMTAILGLYEFPGGADNPAIIAMAKACGGRIAREYKHDAIPWCALAANYCLISAGLPGNDSLWALDFRKYGKPLAGPAVGAIATKTRAGGGHVFLVVGRTPSGLLVGRGGNQSDMMCDQIFDPSVCRFNWPADFPAPAHVTVAALPIVSPALKARKNVVLPPPSKLETSGKGEVVPPKIEKPIGGAAGAGAAAAGAVWWDWIAAHPFATALSVVGLVLVAAAVSYAIRRHFNSKQETPTPGIVPVAA
jgi:uncharacterized protein (TIGR02594 family)